MDKGEKLAHSRKKLQKYRDKMAAKKADSDSLPPNHHGREEEERPLHHGDPNHSFGSLPSSLDRHENGSPCGRGHHSTGGRQVDVLRDCTSQEGKEREEKERAFLEEQVRAHAQTVDVLVSEKSSLQKKLSGLMEQFQESQEAHASSQLYLQSAQRRQSELERERTALEERVLDVEREVRKLTLQNSQLLSESSLLRSTAEDLEQQRDELGSKLKAQQNEHQLVQRRCSHLEVQLIQRGVVGGGANTQGVENDAVLPEVQKWKNECEKLKESSRRTSLDKDDLLDQVAAVKAQQDKEREERSREKEVLESSMAQAQSESEEMTARIQQLEMLLSESKREQESSAETLSLDHSLMLEDLQGRLTGGEKENQLLSQQLQDQLSDNSRLNQTISSQRGQIESLEQRVQQLSSDSVDGRALLDTMQQDRENLSRSVLQNKELRSQLAELEGEFVKMSHKNMEYASELDSGKFAKHSLQASSEEQTARIASLQSELEVLRLDLQRRVEEEGERGQERRAEPIQTSSEDIDAPFRGDVERLSESLEDGEWRSRTSQTNPWSTVSEERSTRYQSTSQEDTSLQEEVSVLQSERTRLATQLQTALEEREDLSHQLVETLAEKDSLTNRLQSLAGSAAQEEMESQGNHMIQDMYQELLTNFNSLQERFTKVISENANLMDRVQEFEYITIQLEGENATIAEYIDLYHQRRRHLKDRVLEKDEFISKLLHERDQLNAHLSRLQAAAEQYVHTPQAPNTSSAAAGHRHSLEQEHNDSDSFEEEDDEDEEEDEEEDSLEEEEEDSKKKLRAVLQTLQSGRDGLPQNHLDIVVPCPCCVGETINL